MNPTLLIPTLLAAIVLTACSEQNAAKVAPWLGMKTLNESKADTLSKRPMRLAERCFGGNDARTMDTCLRETKKQWDVAAELYYRDCGYGNKSACRKYREQQLKWSVWMTLGTDG